MKLKWIKSEQRYGQSYEGFAGPYPVASIHWDATRTVGDPLVWRTVMHLPAREGKTWKSRSFKTLDEAKAYLDALATVWFDNVKEEAQ